MQQDSLSDPKKHLSNIAGIFSTFAALEEQRKAGKAVPTLLDILVQLDVIEALDGYLLGNGWHISRETGRICATTAIDHTRSWVYVNPDDNRHCDLYTAIFNAIHVVPERCLSCWKVVVKLDTVAQLMALLSELVNFCAGWEGKGRYCKCGMEERQWVPYRYGAYFYCDSEAEGQQRYKEVFDLMAAHPLLAPLLDKKDDRGRTTAIILKRYCTEFELKLGPSDRYPPKKTEAQRMLEAKIMEAVDRPEGNQRQPKYLIEHCIRRWLQFAWDRGDMTCKLFNAGGNLYTPTVAYHPPAKKE